MGNRDYEFTEKKNDDAKEDTEKNGIKMIQLESFRSSPNPS